MLIIWRISSMEILVPSLAKKLDTINKKYRSIFHIIDKQMKRLILLL